MHIMIVDDFEIQKYTFFTVVLANFLMFIKLGVTKCVLLHPN